MLLPTPLALPFDVMPITLVERAANTLFQRILRNHPDLFERLGEHRAKRFAFKPSDLSLVFLVNPHGPTLHVRRKADSLDADATVEGPLLLLLALLEGRYDADALFFSRELSVVGDMEAMLAMRNTLDDCDIDLPRDLSTLAGPLAPIVGRLSSQIRSRALAEGNAAWN